jgi:hypothetical protein
VNSVTTGGDFYFLARVAHQDISQDKGFTLWTGTNGQIESKTLEFTTGNFGDYYLIWGIHNGGGIAIDDIRILKLQESFEKGSFGNTDYTSGFQNSGSITYDPQKVVDGGFSVYGTSQANTEWYEFLYTDVSKIHFVPNTTYSITFTSKVNSLEPMGSFYFFARVAHGDYSQDKGSTVWTGVPGQVETKTVQITMGDYDDYYLIWGIHNGGSISIDEIRIDK